MSLYSRSSSLRSEACSGREGPDAPGGAGREPLRGGAAAAGAGA